MRAILGIGALVPQGRLCERLLEVNGAKHFAAARHYACLIVRLRPSVVAAEM